MRAEEARVHLARREEEQRTEHSQSKAQAEDSEHKIVVGGTDPKNRLSRRRAERVTSHKYAPAIRCGSWGCRESRRAWRWWWPRCSACGRRGSSCMNDWLQ